MHIQSRKITDKRAPGPSLLPSLPSSFPSAILSFTVSHFCCVLTPRSLREQPAEPAAEAGLRRDHAVPQGGHSGVGEDAGDAGQGKGQIQPGKHTCCRHTRYKHQAAQKHVCQRFAEVFALGSESPECRQTLPKASCMKLQKKTNFPLQ